MPPSKLPPAVLAALGLASQSVLGTACVCLSVYTKDDTAEQETATACLSQAYDGDGDGYGADVDCDDEDPAVNPGADDICGDEVDNDCDDAVDDGCDTGAADRQALAEALSRLISEGVLPPDLASGPAASKGPP